MRIPATLITLALLLAPTPALADRFPSETYVEAADQTLAPPPADQAQIVFLQPAKPMGIAAQVALYEVVDGESRLLAITGSRSRTVLQFSPGHHVLMSSFGVHRAFFLDATVEAGKRYFVLERFIPTAGYQLRPLRPNGPGEYSLANPDFPKWMATTRVFEPFSASEGWYREHKADTVDKSQAAAWSEWLGKSDAQRAELTLNPEDAQAP